jgi:diguanylate cyclase (GGDEF)-like protein
MFEDVLIADDDLVSRRLLQVSLAGAGYRVLTASNGAEALRVLSEPDGPRLVVLDWMMPSLDGVDVCRVVRDSGREPYIYMILLTAKGHQTEIIQGLEAGADDYVIKPFDPQELKARLRAGKRILELHEQVVMAREQLRVQATHDSLTALLNRMAILEALDREAARCRRENKPLAAIMGDVDNFKNINDSHGHQAGDAVLREIARRLSASLRAYDSIGRYGGEEFLIVAPGSDLAGAVELAERLRQSVSAQPISTEGAPIRATVSLGVAVSDGEAGKLQKLLRQADESLYAAKKAGRNRVEALQDRSRTAELPQVR